MIAREPARRDTAYNLRNVCCLGEWPRAGAQLPTECRLSFRRHIWMSIGPLSYHFRVGRVLGGMSQSYAGDQRAECPVVVLADGTCFITYRSAVVRCSGIGDMRPLCPGCSRALRERGCAPKPSQAKPSQARPGQAIICRDFHRVIGARTSTGTLMGGSDRPDDAIVAQASPALRAVRNT
jgi:hypothetical protein